MIAKINRHNYDIYAMDIETHNDEESRAKRETSMWLGCFINEESKEDDERSYFYTIDEFLDLCEEMTHKKRRTANETRKTQNLAVYIYNLSFEWSFILPVLLKRGFKFNADMDESSEFCYNSVSTKSVSSVWQVHIKFGKKHGDLLIRDLAKIYGGGLADVAKAFKLPTQKGEIDYTKNRLHGPFDEQGRYIPTQEEKIYCFKDTRIIIDILLEEIRRGDKDFFKAVSMASYSMLKLLKKGFPRALKPYREYRKLYPELGEEENIFGRKALAGGICYATPNYQFIEVTGKIGHVDGHQMHPSQVYAHPHPYGVGTYFKGRPTCLFKHINICHIYVSYDAVLIHSVIKLIGRSSADMVELYVYDFEIPTMRKCYVNLKIEFIDGYCYKARFLPWRDYVKDNYIQRLKAKKEGDNYNTLRYKLLNNSGAYGKFVEKPHTEVFENYINENGIIDSIITNREFENAMQMYNAKYTYIPLGSIPAWSRVELCEHALKLYGDKTKPGGGYILYFDTDSIFFILNEYTEKVLYSEFNLKDELTGWNLEEICLRAQFAAPKRYKTEKEDKDGRIKPNIKAGGINFDAYKEHTHAEELAYYMETYNCTKKEALNMIDIPFDEVNIINSDWDVQRAYRVRGGTIIEFQQKSMNVQKKYLDIYNKNRVK